MTELTMTRDSQTDTSTARRAMIDSQLRTSGVNEEYVLARMLAVPREDFLPAEKHAQAYTDRAVLLGGDGHLAAPLFYGKALLEAAPMPETRALVVSGGTGYLAALLRPLVAALTEVSAEDAATGKAVALTSSYTGADKDNYLITDQASSTASISKREITGVTGVSAQGKVYDGTTTARVSVVKPTFGNSLS